MTDRRPGIAGTHRQAGSGAVRGRSLRLVVLAAVTGALLSACAPGRWEKPQPPAVAVPKAPSAPVTVLETAPPPIPQSPAIGTPGNPPFYEVLGERYYVLPTSNGYRQRGIASWYGEPFHGRKTSSGVVYDMHLLTAAHKTLPLPSVVRVTNVQSGRSVVVTVNDRGPFAKNRVIDLSYGAAQALGIVKSGTAEVEIEALVPRAAAGPIRAAAPTGGTLPLAGSSGDGATPELPASSASQASHRIFMQVGAFSERGNAEQLKARLEAQGVSDVVIRYDDAGRPAMYRVRIGPLDGPTEYDALAARISALRIPGPRLVTESPPASGTRAHPEG